MVAGGCAGGTGWGAGLTGTVSVWADEKVLEMEGGASCTTV